LISKIEHLPESPNFFYGDQGWGKLTKLPFMSNALSFLHLVCVGIVTLFPPVNPVGTALIVDPLLVGLDRPGRKAASKRIALYCLAICTLTIVAGSWFLKLFGISIPVVQIAGGIMICRMGWQLLSSDRGAKDEGETTRPHREGGAEIDNILFYPVAFPMTTGAGTISVLLTLSAHGDSNDFSLHIINLSALFLSIFLMCLLIYLCFAFTPSLIKKLGARGEQIVNRLSAFLVFCVGIQIALGGISHFFKI
jgi:multiple antibiotic resistance protein